MEKFKKIASMSVQSECVRTAVKAVLCAFFVCCVMSLLEFDAQSREIAGEVVRVHILANSDGEEDQALKLRVRDRVLLLCADLYPKGCTREEAEEIISRNLPEIERTARYALRECGCDCPVSACLVNMYFSNRTYGDITLPAGNYDALRITIGRGEGHNWWCVMFPPVCVGTASDISDVLSDEQTRLVESGTTYKFKIYEIYENIVNKLSGK